MSEKAGKAPHLITLILLSGLSVASLNLFLPSLPNIASEFGVDYALASLTIAGYAAVAAVLQLVVGPLSDRFGRRPVLLASLAIFSLASVGCVLAADFWTFLFFRMLQAVIVSGFTLSRAVIMDAYGAQKGASLMGYIGMAWAAAPLLAPMLGGVLDELFGWRASFWTFLVFGAMLLAICWVDLRETNVNRSETLLKQLRTYPELLRSGRFWGYALWTAFSVSAFYAFIAGAPLVGSAVFQISPAQLGVYLGSTTVGFVLGSYLAGRLSARLPLTTMMIAGRVVACAGLVLGLLILSAGVVHELTLFGACVFVGLGNGVTMPSSNSGTMSVRPKLAGSASGLSGALTSASGAAFSAIIGAVLTVDNAAYGLLTVMLLASALGLAAAVFVQRIDRDAIATS
jgi:MFS transporter, DHA1 family, multidrug resistance protein